MMPILTTRPVTSALIKPPGAVSLPLTQDATLQRYPAWLGTLRQRFRRQAPQPIQVSDTFLTRRAGELVQHEIAFAAACQGRHC